MTPPTPASGRADAPDVQLVTAEELQLEPLDEDTLPDPVPAGAPGDDDREPTIDTVPERAAAEQAARTDLALGAWRDESARRGAAFAERQARLDAVSALQRRQMLAAGGLGAVGGLLVLLFGAAWLATPPPAVHPDRKSVV